MCLLATTLTNSPRIPYIFLIDCKRQVMNSTKKKQPHLASKVAQSTTFYHKGEKVMFLQPYDRDDVSGCKVALPSGMFVMFQGCYKSTLLLPCGSWSLYTGFNNAHAGWEDTNSWRKHQKTKLKRRSVIYSQVYEALDVNGEHCGVSVPLCCWFFAYAQAICFCTISTVFFLFQEPVK